jgi:hypothetical protein
LGLDCNRSDVIAYYHDDGRVLLPEPDLEFLKELRDKAIRNTCGLAKDADDARYLIAMLGLDKPVEETRYHDFAGHLPKGA